MNVQRSSSWRAACAAAILAVVLFGAGGCSDDAPEGAAAKPSSAEAARDSGTDGKQSEESSPQSSLAEVKNGDISLAVTAAVREDGGFVTVSGTVTNNGGEFWSAAEWKSDENELSANGASLAGASLVDEKNKKKYLVLRDTAGKCLCTRFTGAGVDAGKTTDWYAQFPAPAEDATEVKFQVGSMPPATVQLSAGE
ncbi:hypothetical protein [Streptomyces abyssomicinicus]|uniref:hypothetical protein n=1 Tax=Streptomyces abyssomicinicus TaxID=574929 RepID=UPI0012507EE2|nr:hypothetical protein [Streptomyces abyssomicinicus]